MIKDRMPPLAAERMTPAQKKAAAELAAGPRGGVRGPFIPLLRSPELLDRLQKVGEYLRYQSSLETRLNEFVMLIVARQWSQQFEYATYRSAVDRFGEQGVIDMLGLIGYFTTVSMVMNVAHTPPPDDPSVSPLDAFPR